jgi:hypothetical protein
MSFWSAIVVIVAILAFANMRIARYRAGPGHALPEPRDAGNANPALQREVIELRKRVEVLERILTDGRDANRLAQDIEALHEH